jgi:hypothetical protein
MARRYRDRYWRDGKEIRIYHPDYTEPLFSQRL